MVDAWPISLPQSILLDGYQDGIPEGRIKSPTDTGPGKQRRRSSAASRNVTGRMLLTEEQLDTMRYFIEVTIVGGSLPFTFKDPVNNAPSLVRIGDNMPTWFLNGLKYDVALQLEFLP